MQISAKYLLSPTTIYVICIIFIIDLDLYNVSLSASRINKNHLCKTSIVRPTKTIDKDVYLYHYSSSVYIKRVGAYLFAVVW